MKTINTTDHILEALNQHLMKDQLPIQLYFSVKIIRHVKGQRKLLRLIPQKNISEYFSARNTQLQAEFIWKYQIEIQLQLIHKQQNSLFQNCFRQCDKVQPFTHSRQEKQIQMFRISRILFEVLQCENMNEFESVVETFESLIFSKQVRESKMKILLNLFNPMNGFTILHEATYYNKWNFLSKVLDQYEHQFDLNKKSICDFTPISIAICTQNQKILDVFLKIHADYQASTTETYRHQNIDLNIQTAFGWPIILAIQTSNLQILKKIIKRKPIKIEIIDKKTNLNVYETIEKNNIYTEKQKQYLINLLYYKYYEFYSQYLFYEKANPYVFISNTKKSYEEKNPEKIYNPNISISCGEILKLRKPPLFSKVIYLSINPYIGAIEEYELHYKLDNCNQKQKMEKMDKKYHLSFEEIAEFRILEPKEKSWYMKKQFICFLIQEKREGYRHIYASKDVNIIESWRKQLSSSFNFWITYLLNNHGQPGKNRLKQNYKSISDNNLNKTLIKSIHKEFDLLEFFTKNQKQRKQSEEQIINKKESNTNIEVQIKKNMIESKGQVSPQKKQISSQEYIENKYALKFKDFRLLKMLGEGTFGQVILGLCKRNNKLYALKTFQKKKIILNKQTKFVISQVNILKQIRHPFIISLYFTFQTPNFIYLGLEYCEGKDLSKHLEEEINFCQEDVKIYAAEMVLAVEYLHSIDIIYRDLKPENIMVGKDGHLSLVDFGLSKKTQNNFAKTFCGSPAYLSPEMLDKNGVGRQTDLYSLGAVIYELLVGEPPFFSDNITILYQNIKNGIMKFPKIVTPFARDLLQQLLEKNPSKRLGVNGFDELKSHEFFESINWADLMNKQVKAPSRKNIKKGKEKVHNEEQQQKLVNMLHSDFDYSATNLRTNRFRNFTFVREDEFI